MRLGMTRPPFAIALIGSGKGGSILGRGMLFSLGGNRSKHGTKLIVLRHSDGESH